jgi:hypothetical protein
MAAEDVTVHNVDVRNSINAGPDTQSLKKLAEDYTPETSNGQRYITDKARLFTLY